MRISFFEFVNIGSQWWLSVFNVEVNDFDGDLLYVERSNGNWKFDLFWLRPLWIKYINWRESQY